MKAIVQTNYGSPEVLALKDVAMPVLTDDQVLVRVYATSINAGDYFSLRGSPWLVRFMVGFPLPREYIVRFNEIPAALGYAAQGHTSGKVVITVKEDGVSR